MPGNGGRIKSGVKMRERSPRGDRMDVERRLGVDRFVEFGIRTIPHKRGEGKAQHGVRLIERLFRSAMGSGQLPAHANGLRALPGKYERGGLGIQYHYLLPMVEEPGCLRRSYRAHHVIVVVSPHPRALKTKRGRVRHAPPCR